MNCVYVCWKRLFICRHKWLYIAVIAFNISLLPLQEMFVPYETLLIYKRIVMCEMLTLTTLSCLCIIQNAVRC